MASFGLRFAPAFISAEVVNMDRSINRFTRFRENRFQPVASTGSEVHCFPCPDTAKSHDKYSSKYSRVGNHSAAATNYRTEVNVDARHDGVSVPSFGPRAAQRAAAASLVPRQYRIGSNGRTDYRAAPGDDLRALQCS
jgi:hypothetical protein